MLVGITKVRNESLILEDTLRHVLKRVDKVFLLDDASTDNTLEIAQSFDNVFVTRNLEWMDVRDYVETQYRAMMLAEAIKHGATWALCFDADERFVGEFPSLITDVDAYKFQLFDGYITPSTPDDYEGGSLEDLPRLWGPERRDITMLFRTDKAKFIGLDQREPVIDGMTAMSDVLVKHYGKCISRAQFEETCRYYMKWPKYAEKWAQRLDEGCVHTQSDFGRDLVTWEQISGFSYGCLGL